MINYPMQGPLVNKRAGQLSLLNSKRADAGCHLSHQVNVAWVAQQTDLLSLNAVCAVDKPHPSLILYDMKPPTLPQCSIVELTERAQWKCDPP